jgi:membrane protein implicated in regulation of membrane protease activity
MDPADFAYNYKYKFIVPFFYLASWSLMFLGPFLIPELYQKICLYLFLHLAVKTIFLVGIAIISYFKAKRILNRAEEMKSNKMIQGLNNNPYWN